MRVTTHFLTAFIVPTFFVVSTFSSCRSTAPNSSIKEVARSSESNVGVDCKLEELTASLEIMDRSGKQFIGELIKETVTSGKASFFAVSENSSSVSGKFNLIDCTLEVTGMGSIGLPDKFKVQLDRSEHVFYSFRGLNYPQPPVEVAGKKIIGYRGKPDSENGISLQTGVLSPRTEYMPSKYLCFDIAYWYLKESLDSSPGFSEANSGLFGDAANCMLRIGFSDVKSLVAFVESRIAAGKDPFSVNVDFKEFKERVQLQLFTGPNLDVGSEVSSLPWAFKDGAWRNETVALPTTTRQVVRANPEQSKHLSILLKKLTAKVASVKEIAATDHLFSRSQQTSYQVSFKSVSDARNFLNSALQSKYVPAPLLGDFGEQVGGIHALSGLPLILTVEK